MIKVGEHITLDIIGTTKEYDSPVFEKVINKIAKAANKEAKVIYPFIAFHFYELWSSSEKVFLYQLLHTFYAKVL